ncbi:PucR family transcriptional regulator [Pseudalkalibacillus sp. Hm43]|uniref:PucR family transcriptional regulator n=1 Tax=Pseudalkalibacillus sp. Hm43 TaxID=3450742 RepID=UPI003F422ECB
MTDLHKLKNILGRDNVIQHNHEKGTDEEFLWYRTQEGEELGIRKTAVTSDNEQLLGVFLTPLASRPMDEDQTQSAWFELLYNDRTSDKNYRIEKGRLLHFQINSEDVEHELFVEAFQNMLSPDIIPVWRDRYSGVFIEPSDLPPTTVQQLDELIHTIESDFYMKTTMFIGSPFSSIQEAKKCFDKEEDFYEVVAEYPQRSQIYTLTSALPAILLHQAKRDDLTYVQNQILKEVDTELLNTVKVLLECDLNYSLAAKKLFIHRNSLQYRIEKFSDLTGLDPKTFMDAVTCHLLFLSLD